jgi:hypothetical protein
MLRVALLAALAAVIVSPSAAPGQTLQPVVPPEERGRIDAERSGTHDAANLRTVFYNFGMVGDYPGDPLNVDLSVFHSVEVPKGTGMNYSDGITPFVLSRIVQTNAQVAYIMETGFRERQQESPFTGRIMRFEPRPGYLQADPGINAGRSIAISSDPRTWPDAWPDKRNDPDDPGWAGSWNGYFGKRAAADQESYSVMDDDFYDAWLYQPDSRDATRHGLGLRVEVRGFQWANPQAGNVIFWHYDITNESTTDYDNNIIFGIYMDSGVGGSALSCDAIAESDDDNAFFDRSSGLNLVYTWDRYGHGRDLSGSCGRTGYLGYAYLETPGNPFDLFDNDNDGVSDERRDGGAGTLTLGQEAILSAAAAAYDTTRFVAFYGPFERRPAYRAGRWWTGDEDMDWLVDLHDVGADGVADTHDSGEGDGQPTGGEPNFDRTDLNESDQIGLTGFKLNRIRSADGSGPTDGIIFFTGLGTDWPGRLYLMFTDPTVENRFDQALATNYNIGFLFASGTFQLRAGQNERFSLALAFGGDLDELRGTVRTVQQIYNANYQFAVPPTRPIVSAETDDGRVRLTWDDASKRSVDPVTGEFDFEGYRIYRATDPDFRDARVVTNATGSNVVGNGRPIVQFDLPDGVKGFSRKQVEGVAYYLGNDSGIRHNWTDSTVVNGQEYYYAVCAFDYGYDQGPELDSLSFYPSENSYNVSRTTRGGIILPTNVVRVRPNPRVSGFTRASAGVAARLLGRGVGSIGVDVVNSSLVPRDHLFKLTFTTSAPESIRAMNYVMTDSTTGERLFHLGADLEGAGSGPVGAGLLPIVTTPPITTVDSSRTGWAAGSATNTRMAAVYQRILSPNLRRPGYPDDIRIVFDDVVRDTGLAAFPIVARPARFRVLARTDTGDVQLDFRFRDNDANGTLSRADEFVDVATYAYFSPSPQWTWRVALDTLGQAARGPIVPPRLGDTWDLALSRPFGTEDVFVFSATAQSVDASAASASRPYVVPNPYVGAASFEPARFAISGRGERRIEFRGLAQGAVVRIYTVSGALVQTLRHDGSNDGFVPWNLRTKDNLDLAPGLYVFQVETPGADDFIGKFAIIK